MNLLTVTLVPGTEPPRFAGWLLAVLVMLILLPGCASTPQQDSGIQDGVESSQEDDPFLIPSRLPVVKPPNGVLNPANSPVESIPDRPKATIAQPQLSGTVGPFLPKGIHDADGWARDMTVAFKALKLPLNEQNICAVVAVTEQESSFNANPPVAGLPKIVRSAISQRAEQLAIPDVAVNLALAVHSPDGRTYAERIDALKTENDLNALYADMTSELPLGRQLLKRYNPVKTGGPMQVSLKFAEQQIKDKPYPYSIQSSLRDEVFSRRGGLYFGMAYLLDYPASYDQMLYRFADFNAGRYASRNAAFQVAIQQLSGQSLNADGDLLRYANGDISGEPSQTQRAVFLLADRLKLTEGEIVRDLKREKTADFDKTPLFLRVLALANQAMGNMPQARLPDIQLNSPKITHGLTTAKFAKRVDERFHACLKRG
jgi:hypothetical protein